MCIKIKKKKKLKNSLGPWKRWLWLVIEVTAWVRFAVHKGTEILGFDHLIEVWLYAAPFSLLAIWHFDSCFYFIKCNIINVMINDVTLTTWKVTSLPFLISVFIFTRITLDGFFYHQNHIRSVSYAHLNLIINHLRRHDGQWTFLNIAQCKEI